MVRRAPTDLLIAAAVASTELVEKVFRVDLLKALDPLDPKGFLQITQRFARELGTAVKPLEDAAVKRALQRLDVDWPNLTAAQRTAAVKAANAALKPLERKAPAAVTVKFEKTSEAVIEGTRRGVKRRFARSIESSMTLRDEKTSEFLVGSHANYVRDEYGRRSSVFAELAREIVAGGLEQGLGREDIAEDLAQRLGEEGVYKTEAYWDVVANAFVSRARSATTISAFDEAEIEQFQFEAVLDEATTEICRFLHGQVFSVSKASGILQSIEEDDDPEAIKERTPWVDQGVDDEGRDVLFFKRGEERVTVARVDSPGEGAKDKIGEYSSAMSPEDLEDNGVPIPPIHGLCRSTIIAVE